MSSSDFSHHFRPNIDDRQSHGSTDDSDDGSGSDTDTESNVGDSKSGNGLEHTDTEIIGDVSASGAGYSGSQSSLMSVPSQLIRDTMDEVLAKPNDGKNDEEGKDGTGKLRGSLELSGHEEYEAQCISIDEDRDTNSDTETERGIGHGCAYTSFPTVSSISPTSSTSGLSSSSQSSSSFVGSSANNHPHLTFLLTTRRDFVGRTCAIHARTVNRTHSDLPGKANWRLLTYIYPENANRKQTFTLPSLFVYDMARISPTSLTSDLSSSSQSSSSFESDNPPPAPPAISSVAGPTTTTHPKQPPAPPSPQTGLPDIPVLWSERDAAAELPKNHNLISITQRYVSYN
ncbi:hypothetical protein F5877DRAFT_78490 [Lentinula edodes]|nr:hypothetical protein F5877DRAFT_78490 [Lentinula edodes]